MMMPSLLVQIKKAEYEAGYFHTLSELTVKGSVVLT